MDDQKVRDMGAEAARTASDTMEQARTAAKTVGEQATRTASDTMEQARSMAKSVGEQARNVGEQARKMGEQAMSAATSAGTTAQEVARQARDQASAASDMIYQQGARAGDYLSRNVNEYPLTAVLIAGMIGYGLAYLVHSRQGE